MTTPRRTTRHDSAPGRVHRPRQPQQRLRRKPLCRGLGRVRRDGPAARDPGRLRALVRRCDARHRVGAPAHRARLHQLSSALVRLSLSGAGRSGARAARARAARAVAGRARRALGLRSRRVGGIGQRLPGGEHPGDPAEHRPHAAAGVALRDGVAARAAARRGRSDPRQRQHRPQHRNLAERLAGRAGRLEERFAVDVDRRLEQGDHAALVAYEKLGPDATLAIPTPDHTCRCSTRSVCSAPANASRRSSAAPTATDSACSRSRSMRSERSSDFE